MNPSTAVPPPPPANDLGWPLEVATGIPVFLAIVYVLNRWFNRPSQTE